MKNQQQGACRGTGRRSLCLAFQKGAAEKILIDMGAYAGYNHTNSIGMYQI